MNTYWEVKNYRNVWPYNYKKVAQQKSVYIVWAGRYLTKKVNC